MTLPCATTWPASKNSVSATATVTGCTISGSAAPFRVMVTVLGRTRRTIHHRNIVSDRQGLSAPRKSRSLSGMLNDQSTPQNRYPWNHGKVVSSAV